MNSSMLSKIDIYVDRQTTALLELADNGIRPHKTVLLETIITDKAYDRYLPLIESISNVSDKLAATKVDLRKKRTIDWRAFIKKIKDALSNMWRWVTATTRTIGELITGKVKLRQVLSRIKEVKANIDETKDRDKTPEQKETVKNLNALITQTETAIVKIEKIQEKKEAIEEKIKEKEEAEEKVKEKEETKEPKKTEPVLSDEEREDKHAEIIVNKIGENKKEELLDKLDKDKEESLKELDKDDDIEYEKDLNKCLGILDSDIYSLINAVASEHLMDKHFLPREVVNGKVIVMKSYYVISRRIPREIADKLQNRIDKITQSTISECRRFVKNNSTEHDHVDYTSLVFKWRDENLNDFIQPHLDELKDFIITDINPSTENFIKKYIMNDWKEFIKDISKWHLRDLISHIKEVLTDLYKNTIGSNIDNICEEIAIDEAFPKIIKIDSIDDIIVRNYLYGNFHVSSILIDIKTSSPAATAYNNIIQSVCSSSKVKNMVMNMNIGPELYRYSNTVSDEFDKKIMKAMGPVRMSKYALNGKNIEAVMESTLFKSVDLADLTQDHIKKVIDKAKSNELTMNEAKKVINSIYNASMKNGIEIMDLVLANAKDIVKGDKELERSVYKKVKAIYDSIDDDLSSLY